MSVHREANDRFGKLFAVYGNEQSFGRSATSNGGFMHQTKLVFITSTVKRKTGNKTNLSHFRRPAELILKTGKNPGN